MAVRRDYDLRGFDPKMPIGDNEVIYFIGTYERTGGTFEVIYHVQDVNARVLLVNGSLPRLTLRGRLNDQLDLAEEIIPKYFNCSLNPVKPESKMASTIS